MQWTITRDGERGGMVLARLILSGQPTGQIFAKPEEVDDLVAQLGAERDAVLGREAIRVALSAAATESTLEAARRVAGHYEIASAAKLTWQERAEKAEARAESLLAEATRAVRRAEASEAASSKATSQMVTLTRVVSERDEARIRESGLETIIAAVAREVECHEKRDPGARPEWPLYMRVDRCIDEALKVATERTRERDEARRDVSAPCDRCGHGKSSSWSTLERERDEARAERDAARLLLLNAVRSALGRDTLVPQVSPTAIDIGRKDAVEEVRALRSRRAAESAPSLDEVAAVAEQLGPPIDASFDGEEVVEEDDAKHPTPCACNIGHPEMCPHALDEAPRWVREALKEQERSLQGFRAQDMKAVAMTTRFAVARLECTAKYIDALFGSAHALKADACQPMLEAITVLGVLVKAGDDFSALEEGRRKVREEEALRARDAAAAEKARANAACAGCGGPADEGDHATCGAKPSGDLLVHLMEAHPDGRRPACGADDCRLGESSLEKVSCPECLRVSAKAGWALAQARLAELERRVQIANASPTADQPAVPDPAPYAAERFDRQTDTYPSPDVVCRQIAWLTRVANANGAA